MAVRQTQKAGNKKAFAVFSGDDALHPGKFY